MAKSKRLKQFAKPEGLFGKLACRAMNICNQALYKSVLAYAPRDKKASVLEVGYGNGYVLKQMQKSGYAKLYGLEISETMNALARRNFAKEIASGRIDLSLGRIEEMPYGNEQFDYIYTINTMYFWESLDVGFQAIRRVLKTQGVCVIAVYDKRFLAKLPYTKTGFQIYDDTQIEAALKRQQFSIKQVVRKRRGMALCYICEAL